jgi:hypothetical protein
MFSRLAFSALTISVLSSCLLAQGVQPYPDAITNRQFYGKTAMAPLPVNTVFQDPDLGATMVRVTDGNTNQNPNQLNGWFRNPPGDANEWSADNSKFYVEGYDTTNLAFAFYPTTMTIGPLPGAAPGGGLNIPLREGPTFSFVDSDLMYGTVLKSPLTIATYRFSTNQVTPLFDTTTCNTVPALVAGPKQSSNDTTTSNDDRRIVISAGGSSFGKRPFVIVYDQKRGCRWYNTQTGQVGGSWGPKGLVSLPDRFSVNHSKISGNGQYVRISVDRIGFYVWDITSLNLQYCNIKTGPKCSGYGAVGYDTFLNAPGSHDELNTFLRPLDDLTDLTQLINPLPKPYYNGMQKSWAWSNGAFDGDSLPPACGTLFSPSGDEDVKQPYDGEVFCIETDGVGQTIWRFAHNRAVWNPAYYWSQPYGNISLDGHFFSFTSSWDNQVGTDPDGDPRTDIWIVHLQ